MEQLDQRVLLTISDIAVEPVSTASEVSVTWSDSGHQEDSEYEFWIDQLVGSSARNTKIYHEVVQPGQRLQYRLTQEFSPGDYRLWIRRIDNATRGPWVSHQFQLDDDDNPATPLTLQPPDRAQITVHRQGQGAAGQKSSEGGFAWTGNATLYDVWLGTRDAAGRLTPVSIIRNVPRRSIALRELAIFADGSRAVRFTDASNLNSLAQLPTGNYELYVRGINGAVSDCGQWAGRGRWSQRYSFSFHQVEGADAIPQNLTATNEIRPTISWDPVPHADAYLVSVWKGPDYANHRPLTMTVYGTSVTLHNRTIADNTTVETIAPGDELFIRVRGVGSEGSLEGLRSGNYAQTVVRVPQALTVSDLPAPVLTGPSSAISDRFPVLRWEHSENAATYDVWFSSLDNGRRLFLASGVSTNLLPLNRLALSQFSNMTDDAIDGFEADGGLQDGRYRFWVRSNNPASDSPGKWSRSRTFSVSAASRNVLALTANESPAATPLVSPNLMETYTSEGRRFLLVSTGLGESFGPSVLARYELTDDGTPRRPIVSNLQTGADQLEFADLPVGSNVADMAFLNSRQLVILSRGSNSVHVVDVESWQVLSAYHFASGGDDESPDAMDLEILSNGQILVVFNRSNRLRILQTLVSGQLSEVAVPGTATAERGFSLSLGRAVHVSAVQHADGTYRLFLATPGRRSIAVYQYNPGEVSLTPVNFPDAATNVISRDPDSTPHVGARVVTIATEGVSHQYFVSTDRNGFVTWINILDLTWGSLDLATFVDPDARNPESDSYQDPDESHVDPSRIIDLGKNNFAFLNNRIESVILQLYRDSNGALQAQLGTTIPTAYGGTVVDTEYTTQRLYTTAGAGLDISVGSHDIDISTLEFRDNVWAAVDHSVFTASRPIDRVTEVSDTMLFVEYPHQQRSIIQYRGNALREIPFDARFSFDGTVYHTAGGAAGGYHDAHSERSFVVYRVSSENSGTTQNSVAIVDVTNPENPEIHSVHAIDTEHLWFSVEMTADRIVVQDRLRATSFVVLNWQTSSAFTRTVTLGDRHPRGYGGIRAARAAILVGGTTVFVHDTSPDRGFSVFTGDSLTTESAVANVHQINIGQWAFDVHAFDSDRVIATTFDAKIVVLNIRTGVFELVEDLSPLKELGLDLYGARATDFRDGSFTISAPPTGTVAEFSVTRNSRTGDYSVQLTRTTPAPEAVSTLFTPTGHWIVEATQVTRIPR